MTRTIWTSLIVLYFVIYFVESCRTYIAIWPTGKTSFEATLQLKWDRDCDPKPTTIKLFDKDPVISEKSPKIVLDIQNVSATHIEIDRRVGKIFFPGGWNRGDRFEVNATKPKSYPRGRCLPYYVASYKNDELLSVNCLKIQPNWMRLNSHVGDIMLKNLFLPGTHASGAYYNITKKGSTKIEKYFNTQNFDIWSQLVFGVRYLDLAIGTKWKQNDEKCSFWAINQDTNVNPLEVIFRDIADFVETSGEVVLIDLSSLDIASKDDIICNKEFVNFIEEKIGLFVYRNIPTVNQKESFDLSVNEIINNGKHIILMAPIHRLHQSKIESDLFWPSLKTFSTDARNESEILKEMRQMFSGKSNVSTSIFHFNREHKDLPMINGQVSTTRDRAMTLSPKIKDWLSGPWSLNANVVTADFIMSTNLIELAISTNRYKAYRIANNFISFQVVD